MTETWVAIAGLVLATAALRAAGPALLGDRALPTRFAGFVALLAPVLLTALIVTRTFETEGGLAVDARAVGLTCAAVAAAARAPLLVTVVAAAVGAAVVRAVLG